MSSRMNAPTALRQGNLTLQNGSLNRPSFRWAKEPGSGLARLAAGYTAIVINRFRALEVGQNDTMVRSNAAGAGNVAPLAFARANATTADGQETAVDGYEVATRIGRLSLYRQTATKNGWRLYGSTGGVLSGTADLQVDADGNATARTSLTTPTATLSATAGNTALSIPNGNVVLAAGTLTLSRAAGSVALNVANANATIGGTLGVTGAITGGSLGVGAGAISGGAITGTSLSVGAGNIAGGAISGTSLNVGAGSISGGTIIAGAISGTSINVGAGSISGGAISGTTLTLSSNLSAGALNGTSLNVGGGSISGGAIGGTSLNVGGGAITGGTISGSTGTFSNNLSANNGRIATAASAGISANLQVLGSVNERSEILLGAHALTYQGVIGLSSAGGQYLADTAGDLSIYTTAGDLYLGANSGLRISMFSTGGMTLHGNVVVTGILSGNSGIAAGALSGAALSVSGVTLTTGVSPGGIAMPTCAGWMKMLINTATVWVAYWI